MITLSRITLRRGTKVVLADASLTIHPGEKVALVGRNGAGKSSLFALMNGSLHEDSGDLAMPAGWRLAQVAQDIPEVTDSATDFVLAGDTRLAQAQAALQQAEASADGMAIAHAHTALHDAGAHDARARAQALILGLGFAPDALDRPVNSFSGGWRMRLQLARALMCPSDVLLLDEPTNHLDLDALVWLEGWLDRYTGTLLVISHDREFLDATTQVTVHIEHAQLTRYSGNYSAFEAQHAQQLVLQQAAWARQQQHMAHLQSFIDRFKAKATKARQAQSRIKALERMEKIAPVLAQAEFTFSFADTPQLPNPMLSVRDGQFGYLPRAPSSPPAQSHIASDIPDYATTSANQTADATQNQATRTILRGVNRSVLAGQRIGVLGANGQGKSTFIKTIAHALPLLSGHITEGRGLRIGYFAQQELDILDPHDHPLGHMLRLARAHPDIAAQAGREQDLRNFLGGFLFSGDMVLQATGSMSGGEKARLVLAMLVWQRPNLLLLDEPTNHLDLHTREALAVALNTFEGSVMLVSHDRALLRSVCDEFWLVGDGGIRPFDGDLDDYQRYLLDIARQRRDALRNGQHQPARSTEPESHAAASTTSHTPNSSPPTQPAFSGAELRRQQAEQRQRYLELRRPLARRIAQLETVMAQASDDKSRLETLLCQPISPSEVADAGRALKAATEQLEAAESEWLDLSTQLEALELEHQQTKK